MTREQVPTGSVERPLPATIPAKHNPPPSGLDTFRIRTTHGTYLCVSANGSGLVHSFLPGPQDVVTLFQPHHDSEFGILHGADPFSLHADDDPSCLHLIRIIHRPVTEQVMLRNALGPANLCALADWDRLHDGPTDFSKSGNGPSEQFTLEPVDIPSIPDETGATLHALAMLLGADPTTDTVHAPFESGNPASVSLFQRLATTALAARQAAPVGHALPSTLADVHLETRAAGLGLFHSTGSFERFVDRDATRFSVMQHLQGGWQHRRRQPSFSSTTVPIDPDESIRLFATGRRASIAFTLPYRPSHARVRLTVATVAHPAIMTVSVNGWELGRTAISERKGSGSRLDYLVPGEAIQTNELALQIRFDRLPPPGRSATHLLELAGCRLDLGPEVKLVDIPDDPATLLGCFESLGDNCEFGFVQRHFGIKRLGLLTFAGVKRMHNLLDLLDSDLAGIGDPGTIVAAEATATLRSGNAAPHYIREFFLGDKRYNLSFHTFKGPPDQTEAEALQENEIKLRFLRRKFIEDLEDATKIWIFKDAYREDVNEVLSLHSSLNRHAPNKLFWITHPVAGRRAGSIEWVAPGLLRGYSFNPHGDAQWFNADHWLLLCRRAYAAFMAAG